MVRCRSIVGFVLVLAGAALARGENVIANGGFEQLRTGPMLASMSAKVREFYGGTADSPFEQWAFGGRWEGGLYSVGVAGQGHLGKRSCQISCERKGRGGIAARPLKLAGGTTLKISLWAKAENASGGRIFLNLEGSGGDGWDHKDLRTGTYGWTRFSKRVTVPGPKDAEQIVAVFLYVCTEGTVWVDDVSAEIVDPNAPDADEPGPRKPAGIVEPKGSKGYRVNVVPALEKVFREDDFSADVNNIVEVSAARNEYESIQLVVEAPWRAVKVADVRFTDLAGRGGERIAASAMRWDRVEYVQTTVTPPYFAERGLGWYPDPLMPAGPFTVERLSRVPVWVTVKTPKDCPPGIYKGSISIIAENLDPISVGITLTVWDFTLSDETHLRTMTWLAGGIIREFYGNDWSAEGERRHAEATANYERLLLEHRLGPGGEVASSVPKRKDGSYDFSGVDAKLDRLIKGGMNAFIIGTAPNLKRSGEKEYSPQFMAEFPAMIKAYMDHLREKGWGDMAYVYTYDEAPREAWEQVKRIASAVKQAAPQARILQCLNQPEGVKALTGFVDVFDVYVAQYHKAGVSDSQKLGTEVWLALCCYPMDHPNLFLEYPLVDVRATPWICWKYGARGFEYWSPNSWGVNWQQKPDKWPKTPWVANTFGQYNGDGYLIYPGEGMRPYSSIRLEALRDGLEDYEYLWMLDQLVKQATAGGRADVEVAEAKRLLSLAGMVSDAGGFALEPRKYEGYREKLAEAIMRLRASNR